jgi:hypothetical protein
MVDGGTPQASLSNDQTAADRRARNRAWVKRHPLSFIVILIAFLAADLWVQMSTTGQHGSTEDFLLYLGLAVIVCLGYAAIRIHLANRRAQGG